MICDGGTQAFNKSVLRLDVILMPGKMLNLHLIALCGDIVSRVPGTLSVKCLCLKQSSPHRLP